MQLFGELIDDIMFFAVFIYLSLLVSGKIKLRQERQEKFDAMLQRRGMFYKVLVYGGTIGFAILILINIFSFKDRQQNVFNANTQSRRWTQADKDAMTKACIENAKNSYQKDPVGTTSICECVTEKFTSKYTYDQGQELNKKPQQEQIDSVMPLIKSCKNDIKP